MHLKKLEIAGFKSFLERASFQFNTPVTGVVGPNGCGKSNIVDAIKWVTGELSFKELRGRSMEDLIFAGSEQRPPTGMAEVSLLLDNSDHLAPTEYNEFSEISVLRRIFRDGSSEFFINKIPCRLHDIIDLFLDTGIGRSSYSIIEQGRVGMIVSSKPEDRRLIIEEAAGITKYKHRKQAAQRKMEYTRQNLLRVSDVLVELKRQVGSLERAARKAEKFREIRDQARTIDLALSARDFLGIQQKISELLRSERELQDQVTSNQTEIRGAEASLERQRLELLDESKTLEESQANLFRRASAISQFETQVAEAAREAERLVEMAAGERQRSELLRHEVSQADQDLTSLRDVVAALEEERVKIEGELTRAQMEESQFTARLETMEGELEESKNLLLLKVSDLAASRNDCTTAKERLAELDRQKEVRSKEFERTETELSALEKSYQARQKELGAVVQLRFGFEQEREKKKFRLEELRAERVRLEEERLTLSRKIEGEKSRLHTLEEFERTYQGYREGVRAVMERRSGSGPKIKGLLGEMVKPKRGYERALQAALAEKIECLVVEHPREAVAAISFLREEKKGRGVFLPRYLRSSAGRRKTPKADGILGSILDFVSLDESCRASVETLLNDVLLVENLSRATALWEEGIEFTFVTLDGDLVSREGIVVGGSWEQERGVLEVHRESEELREMVQNRNVALENIERRLKETGREAVATELELTEVAEALDRESRKAVDHEKDFERLEEALRRCRQSLDVIEQERLRVTHDRKVVEEMLFTATQKMEAAETTRLELENKINGASEKVATMRVEMKSHAESLTAQQVRKASVTERIDAHIRERDLATYRRDRGAEEIEQLKATVLTHEQEAEERRTKEKELARLRDQAVLDHDAAREKNSAFRTEHEARQQQILEREGELKVAREGVAQASDELNRVRLVSGEERMRSDHLSTQIQERYGVVLTDLVGGTEFALIPEDQVEAERSTLEALRSKMASIGDVNLAAIEEVRELKERELFLSTQKEDLEKTLDSLDSAIKKINVTTKERFIETFEAVDAKFQNVFPRLFRGGKAKLMLTDPDNLLETGVDIAAQPPGKRLQNMNLLSGGEKALTAIALIFAIFQHKAPPFCLLDEVDAPLDDANVHRFLALVREMSATTQFVLITHNKASMEVADNLYGVTMEEPGVSRTVSVRIHQKAAVGSRPEKSTGQAVA